MNLEDRDYTDEFSITMEWGEWTHLYTLASRGVRNPPEDWPDDETEREREIVKEFCMSIGDNNPGNGMDDWPDSMKKAYDETVQEMIEEELSND